METQYRQRWVIILSDARWKSFDFELIHIGGATRKQKDPTNYYTYHDAMDASNFLQEKYPPLRNNIEILNTKGLEEKLEAGLTYNICLV